MAQDTFFTQNNQLILQGIPYSLEDPKIMGILNITPDSFFDGGRYINETEILRQTEKMLDEGADFIDVGGISSKPGSNEITIIDEKERIIPVLRSIKKHFPKAILSADTFRAETAKMALSEGVSIINDISGGRWEPEIFKEVASFGCTSVIMHSRNDFKNMHNDQTYTDIAADVKKEFEISINKAHKSGLKSLIIDPGFGFSKNTEQNFELLNKLEILQKLNLPLLAGISRKSMIWKTLNSSPELALNGTTALHMICLQKGAKILRVHDVKEARECIILHQKIYTHGKKR